MSNEIVEILLTAGLATQDSARNLNRDIKNLEKNNIGKLNLTANLSKESISNLKLQIDAIHKSLPNLDVTLNVKSNPIDTRMFSQMEQQIDSLQLKIKELEDRLRNTGSKPSGSPKNNPFSPTQEGAERTLKSIIELEEHVRKSDGKIKIIDDKETGKVKEVVTTIKNQLGQLETKVYRPKIDIAVGDIGKITKGLQESTQVTNSDVFNNFNKQLEQAKNKLAELGRQGKLSGKSFKDFNKEINSPNLTTIGQLDELINKMKQVGQVDSHNAKWNNATNNIKTQANESIASLEKLKQQASNLGLDTKQFDVMIAKMRSMSNIQITNDAQMNKANQAFSKLSSNVSALKNSTMSFDSAFKSFGNILDSVSRSGLMSANSLDAIRTKITLLNNTDLSMDEKVRRLKDEISQLNAKLGEAKHANKMAEAVQKTKNEVDKLQAALTRVLNSNPRTVDRNVASSIQQEINRLNNIPAFNNTAQVKAYNQEVQNTATSVRQLSSESTTAGRNSMSIIQNMKTALEKFPIWLFTGGIFFGLARGLKDITNNVIELDTAMVNLARVSSAFQFEFDEVISTSIENVTALSGKLSEYLELVNEYARTGKTLDESFDLANTTQTLVNISDLDAKEAMDSITAALISYNLTASESIRIADKINEIDNNFSVTSKILSDGMLKASATASTFGVSLDELLSHITAISSATRESGAIVG